ncbi:MAG: carboxypeptidase-like regulatory domain-containing protein, partial [Mucilaginibacter sp.]
MKPSILNIYSKFLFPLLFFFLLSVTAFAQSKKITGTVLDEKGQTLPGATVKAKSGKVTTATDVNGKFSIDVEATEASLITTFLGYSDQETPINGQSNLTIHLTTSARNLNDIVVIGYGTQRRKDVTGSIASVSAATLSQVPSPNLIDQLKGRTAGVDIVSNGSTPGSAGQIRIRGNRTITQGNNDSQDGPLIVLDGIPYPGSINDF